MSLSNFDDNGRPLSWWARLAAVARLADAAFHEARRTEERVDGLAAAVARLQRAVDFVHGKAERIDRHMRPFGDGVPDEHLTTHFDKRCRRGGPR